ncbi:unnamed protein product [Linum trigynum]|uniref:Uncharacterized protein n=1 Tax=Linum trigynum TaxID=586398 RepID=A0AAV2FCS7_9ROSI
MEHPGAEKLSAYVTPEMETSEETAKAKSRLVVSWPSRRRHCTPPGKVSSSQEEKMRPRASSPCRRLMACARPTEEERKLKPAKETEATRLTVRLEARGTTRRRGSSSSPRGKKEGDDDGYSPRKKKKKWKPEPRAGINNERDVEVPKLRMARGTRQLATGSVAPSSRDESNSGADLVEDATNGKVMRPELSWDCHHLESYSRPKKEETADQEKEAKQIWSGPSPRKEASLDSVVEKESPSGPQRRWTGFSAARGAHHRRGRGGRRASRGRRAGASGPSARTLGQLPGP